jgi:PAS domain S-box-containing protein
MSGPGARSAMGAGLCVAAVGAVVLLGWLSGFDLLKAPLPRSATMQPLTALGLVLSGLGLAASSAGLSRAAAALGLAVLALGSAVLAEYASGVDLGIDRLLFGDAVEAAGTAHPGRMAPATAAGFCLFGAALLPGRRGVGAVAALLGLMLASIPLLGHLYAENTLYAAGPYLTMAVHTAGSFAVLFLGLLALRPPGWLAHLDGQGAGGVAARRLLPAVVGIPVAAGWLAFEAADAGLLPERLASVLVVLGITVMLTAVSIRYAARLDAADVQRRESYERLRLAVEGTRLGTWEVDLRSREAGWSARFAEMCGLAGGEGAGPLDTWLGSLHPGDGERVLSAFRQAAERGTGFEAEYRAGLREGEWRWIASRGHILRDDAGEPVRALGITQDVTERKRAEERQELLLREVNHRVKNSLQLVNALLDMQGRQVADEEARRQLREAAARVRAIVHLHERLYRGADVEHVDFDVYLRALCEDLRASAPEHAILVEAGPVLLPTDSAVPLGLIVTELVTNAIKHARPSGGDGRIEVRFGPAEDGRLELSVRDRGIGLPPGFSPEQAAGSLGMRIIKGLAQKLDADLRTEEAGPGLRWRLRLPGGAEPPPVPELHRPSRA